MTPFEILEAEAQKNLIDMNTMQSTQSVALKAMRIYGMQEYMKGFEDSENASAKRIKELESEIENLETNNPY